MARLKGNMRVIVSLHQDVEIVIMPFRRTQFVDVIVAAWRFDRPERPKLVNLAAMSIDNPKTLLGRVAREI
jgi:hypothetical protein